MYCRSAAGTQIKRMSVIQRNAFTSALINRWSGFGPRQKQTALFHLFYLLFVQNSFQMISFEISHTQDEKVDHISCYTNNTEIFEHEVENASQVDATQDPNNGQHKGDGGCRHCIDDTWNVKWSAVSNVALLVFKSKILLTEDCVSFVFCSVTMTRQLLWAIWWGDTACDRCDKYINPWNTPETWRFFFSEPWDAFCFSGCTYWEWVVKRRRSPQTRNWAGSRRCLFQWCVPASQTLFHIWNQRSYNSKPFLLQTEQALEVLLCVWWFRLHETFAPPLVKASDPPSPCHPQLIPPHCVTPTLPL